MAPLLSLIRGSRRKLAHPAVAITLWSIPFTFAVGYISNIAFTNVYPDPWLSIWNRWDTVNYLAIAEHGYRADDPKMLHFFYLFPLLVNLAGRILRNNLLAGLVLSNLFYLSAMHYLYRLVRLDYAPPIATRAVLYISVFPTAGFFHFAYTESLFLTLCLSALYYARKEKWWLASLAGMLAGASRVPGCLLFPTLLAEYWDQRRKTARELFAPSLLWLGLVPLGLGSYLLANWTYFGNALAFLPISEKYFGAHLATPWSGLISHIESFAWRPPAEMVTICLHESWGILALAGTAALSFGRMRFSYAVYAALSALLVFSSSFWVGFPRYSLVIFPLFILLALYGGRPAFRYPFLVACSLFYSLQVILFAQGFWPV